MIKQKGQAATGITMLVLGLLIAGIIVTSGLMKQRTSTKPSAQTQTFLIIGYIFLDANNNGLREATETTGFRTDVNLTGNTVNNTVQSASTNGYYEFSGLAPGTYTISLTVPEGYSTITNPQSITIGTANRIVNFPLITAFPTPTLPDTRSRVSVQISNDLSPRTNYDLVVYAREGTNGNPIECFRPPNDVTFTQGYCNNLRDGVLHNLYVKIYAVGTTNEVGTSNITSVTPPTTAEYSININNTNLTNPTPTSTLTPAVPTPTITLSPSCQSLYNIIDTAYGSSCGSSNPNYDRIADINKDRQVDILDLTLFGANASEGWCTEKLNNNEDPCQNCPRKDQGNITCETDGCVNLSDYDIFRSYFGQTVNPGSQGDFDANGLVDVSDFEIIRQNYNTCL